LYNREKLVRNHVLLSISIPAVNAEGYLSRGVQGFHVPHHRVSLVRKIVIVIQTISKWESEMASFFPQLPFF
jgi:hypothetical protein